MKCRGIVVGRGVRRSGYLTGLGRDDIKIDFSLNV